MSRLGNNGGRLYSYLGQPVLIDCSFTVDNSAASGVSGLTGQGIKNVFMYSSSPSAANPLTDASASAGYALIQLQENYNRARGLSSAIAPPLSGSALGIDASHLTPGTPYQITAPGHGPAGVCTIVAAADTSGSLASKYFLLYDSYGNTFIIWFYVTGVGGSPPTGVAGTLVQQTIAQNAANTAVATALGATIALLPSGISGVTSFASASVSSATVTCTSNANSPLAGPPADGASPLNTAFTFAVTKYNTNLQCWQGVGLPKGLTPTAGQFFVATAAGFATGGISTGTVKAFGATALTSVELCGNPSSDLGPIPMGGTPNVGGWVLVRFTAPTIDTGAYKAPMIPTAPAAGSQVYLSFMVDAKSAP